MGIIFPEAQVHVDKFTTLSQPPIIKLLGDRNESNWLASHLA